MNQLIIEASGRQLGLLLALNGELYSQVTGDDGRHDQRLLPEVEALLARAGIEFSDLDQVGVGIGPGSFTGIRVALATAQGICMARELDLFPLDSLALMAAGLPTGQYHFVLDARLGEVYQGRYRVDEQGVTVLSPPWLTAIDGLISLDAQDEFVGDGWALVEQQAMVGELAPNGLWVELLGQSAGLAPEACEPAYLRDTVNWKKVSEQPSPLSK